MWSIPRSIADPFVRAQTRSILRSCLSLMVKLPGGSDNLQADVHPGSVLFASLLAIVFQIRGERTVECRELYLRTVLGTIDDCLHPNYSY